MSKRLILLIISLLAMMALIIYLHRPPAPSPPKISPLSDSLQFKIDLKAPALLVYQLPVPPRPQPTRESLNALLSDETSPKIDLNYTEGKVTLRPFAADDQELDRLAKQGEKRLVQAFGSALLVKQELSPVTQEQLAKTHKLIAEQINELQQFLAFPFKYSLVTQPPATLTLQLAGLDKIKEASGDVLLRRYAVPPRGTVAVYLLPDSYSLVKLPLKEGQAPQYLFLDKRRNQRQTDPAAVLAESKALFIPEDLRPFPEIGEGKEQGKLILSVSYRFYPEAEKRFIQFAKGHLGSNLALVIDGEIIAAPKITSRESRGQFGFRLSTALPWDSPEAERFRLSFYQRPLPLPVMVREIPQKGRP
jgi:hypothetical protein